MRTARIGLTTLRRLDKVEASLIDEQGQSRQGVLLVPPILPLAEWERIAVVSQESLRVAAAEDAGVSTLPAPDLPDPHVRREGIDFHRSDPSRSQENEVPMRVLR